MKTVLLVCLALFAVCSARSLCEEGEYCVGMYTETTCDAPEYCSGRTLVCPPLPVHKPSEPCQAAMRGEPVCANGVCPPDFVREEVVVRDLRKMIDLSEYDNALPILCRPGTGMCDLPEPGRIEKPSVGACDELESLTRPEPVVCDGLECFRIPEQAHTKRTNVIHSMFPKSWSISPLTQLAFITVSPLLFYCLFLYFKLTYNTCIAPINPEVAAVLSNTLIDNPQYRMPYGEIEGPNDVRVYPRVEDKGAAQSSTPPEESKDVEGPKDVEGQKGVEKSLSPECEVEPEEEPASASLPQFEMEASAPEE